MVEGKYFDVARQNGRQSAAAERVHEDATCESGESAGKRSNVPLRFIGGTSVSVFLRFLIMAELDT